MSVAEISTSDRRAAGTGSARKFSLSTVVQDTISDTVCFIALFAADLAAVVLSLICALAVIWLVRRIGFNVTSASMTWDIFEKATTQVGVVACAMLAYCVASGHYSKRVPFWTDVRNIAKISFFALIGTGFLEFAFKTATSRLDLVSVWLLFAVNAVLLRSVVRSLLTHAGVWQYKVLLLGDRQGMAGACEALRSDKQLGYSLVGLLPQETLPLDLGPHYFRSLLAAYGARRLLIAVDVGGEHSRRLVKSVVRERVPFSLIPQVDGLPVFDCEQVAFVGHDTVMISYGNSASKPVSRIAKAVFDVGGAALLLLFMGIPMLVIAALIQLDGGCVLFSQERVGAGGRPFRCLKFRTMVMDADRALNDLLDRDPVARAEWMENHKLTRDPRITRIGRFLRASSLDELPQLFNVIRLEMSLVGPRPIVRQEIPRYAEDISFYYDSKPGLTGLWQVSGRSETTYHRRVQLDAWYVRNWSVWHDIMILLKTIPAVIKRHGAR